MPINFLYPDPNKEKIMQELDKLVEILQRPKTPELKKNIRILRKFTKSLFIISHKKYASKELEQYYQKPIAPIQKQVVLRKLTQPPLPPPPSAPLIPTIISPKQPELKQNVISQLREENGILRYDTIEPVMESKDWQVYNFLEPIVKEALKRDPEIIQKPQFLENEIQKIAKQLKIKYSLDYIKKLRYYLTKNIKGYGKIEPLIFDPRIKKIICNSFDDIKVIFGDKMLPTNISFDSNQELNNFIINLGEKYGKKPSELFPLLDLELPNIEIHAEYNPITTSSFTITKQ